MTNIFKNFRLKELNWNILWSKKFVLTILTAFSILAGLQSYFATKKTFIDGGIEYNRYNNYTIFKQSFYHLIQNKDLYILYPNEQWDLFKYSPTFSLLFGGFAMFPDLLGLILWNLANALILFFAIYSLPKINEKQKGLILLLSVFELLTSLQNSQSNALMAGLIILSFALMEKKKMIFASLCLVFSVYIKLFGIVGFAIFLFYPNKLKFIAYSIMWAVVLFLLPLVVISVEQYSFLMQSWAKMLAADHDASYGMSVMGWLNAWVGWAGNKMIIVLVGVFTFLIPLVRFSAYRDAQFRLLLLSSILIWTVIFNHKAESPTFIIAFSGVALWFYSTKKTILTTSLFVFAFIFTTLSPTDLFPRPWRLSLVEPYQLKVFPCIIIWCKIIWDMIVLPVEQKEQSTILNA